MGLGPFRPLKAVGGILPLTTSFILCWRLNPKRCGNRGPAPMLLKQRWPKKLTSFTSQFLVSKTFRSFFFVPIGLAFTQGGVPKMTPSPSDPSSHHRRLWKGDVLLKRSPWIFPWETTSGDGSLGVETLTCCDLKRGAKMMILGHMLVANGASWLSFPLQDCRIFRMPKIGIGGQKFGAELVASAATSSSNVKGPFATSATKQEAVATS